MKLIIEIDVDSSDFDEMDADTLVKESKRKGACVRVEVGSPLGDKGVSRFFDLASEYFKVRTE